MTLRLLERHKETSSRERNGVASFGYSFRTLKINTPWIKHCFVLPSRRRADAITARTKSPETSYSIPPGQQSQRPPELEPDPKYPGLGETQSYSHDIHNGGADRADSQTIPLGLGLCCQWSLELCIMRASSPYIQCWKADVYLAHGTAFGY